MNYFDEYTKKYDMSNPSINYKYYHSYRVQDNMILLAKNMNLPYKDIELASTIGLLHDIGRFEQYKRFKSFNDFNLDHGDYACKLIKENDILKYFNIDKEDYDAAQVEFDNVLKKNENSADAHYGIGVIYEKQGNIVKARSEWRKALKIQVNHPGALQKMSEN